MFFTFEDAVLARFFFAVILKHSCPVRPVRFQSCAFHKCPAAFFGIFTAINRPDVGWIFIEVRSADPKLLAVRVDPLPQAFARNTSLRPCLALYAHEIGRKPVAIAAAAAPTMV